MTKAIAEEFNARIYDFAWTGNFGEARNFSLSKALCNWILILDADEVISPSDHDPLKQIVKEACLKPAAFNFASRDYVSYSNTAGWIQNDGKYVEEEATGFVLNEGNGLRLFPNNENVRFDCYVHGTIAPSLLKCGIEIRKCNIPIHHYGHLNQEKTALKGEMYYQLQKNKFVQKPELSEEDVYYSAIQAAEIGKHEEAIEYFKRLVVTKPAAYIYYNMGLSYLNLGRYEDALLALKQALQLSPHSRDIIVAYSQAEICKGNAKVAILHLEELLNKDPTYQLALLALTVAYFCVNMKNEGFGCIRKLKELNFGCAYYFSEFAKMLISAGQIKYAILLREAGVESGNALDDAIAYYQKALQVNPNDETAYHNIGQILLGFDIEGWFTKREAACLYLLSSQVRNPTPVVVEIGSYMGLSSMIFAKGLKEKLLGKVYCIDPWESTVPSLTDDMRVTVKNLEDQGLSLYNSFIKNMKLAGVSPWIVPTRGYSSGIVKNWSKSIDLLFIDADHSYEATLSDFNNWIHFLKRDGIVILHDVELPSVLAKFYSGPGRVVEECILKNPDFEEGILIDSLFYSRKR